MRAFSDRELKAVLAIGFVTVMVAALMALVGVICLDRGAGVPEYIISLRNSGITLLVLGLLWTGLAAWRKTQP